MRGRTTWSPLLRLFVKKDDFWKKIVLANKRQVVIYNIYLKKNLNLQLYSQSKLYLSQIIYLSNHVCLCLLDSWSCYIVSNKGFHREGSYETSSPLCLFRSDIPNQRSTNGRKYVYENKPRWKVFWEYTIGFEKNNPYSYICNIDRFFIRCHGPIYINIQNIYCCMLEKYDWNNHYLL